MKKLVFLDLDGTIINTCSGKTFAEDCTDFRINLDVVNKLKEIYNNKAIYAIITNQGGIPKYTTLQAFTAKLQAVINFLRVYLQAPVTGVFCTSMDENNPCRKPNTGMLNNVLQQLKEQGTIIEKSDMIMIGDASGKSGDWSDSDKKTAENFGIDYIDVRDFISK